MGVKKWECLWHHSFLKHVYNMGIVPTYTLVHDLHALLLNTI